MPLTANVFVSGRHLGLSGTLSIDWAGFGEIDQALGRSALAFAATSLSALIEKW